MAGDGGGKATLGIPISRSGTPDEVANVICFLLSEAVYITGAACKDNVERNSNASRFINKLFKHGLASLVIPC